MVKYGGTPLDQTFGALADPTRRAILARLAEGEASVGELADPFAISLPAVSRHLKVLETAGLIRRHKAGRVHRCRLDPAPIRQAAGWIAQYRRFWDGQLDQLARYLEQEINQETDREEKPRDRDGNPDKNR